MDVAWSWRRSALFSPICNCQCHIDVVHATALLKGRISADYWRVTTRWFGQDGCFGKSGPIVCSPNSPYISAEEMTSPAYNAKDSAHIRLLQWTIPSEWPEVPVSAFTRLRFLHCMFPSLQDIRIMLARGSSCWRAVFHKTYGEGLLLCVWMQTRDVGGSKIAVWTPISTRKTRKMPCFLWSNSADKTSTEDILSQNPFSGCLNLLMACRIFVIANNQDSRLRWDKCCASKSFLSVI
jgi:hypothetical protein